MFDDSGQWIPAGNGPAWVYRWDTTRVKDGPHKMTVRAFDGAGHSPEVSREVVVKTARPPAPREAGFDPFIPILVVVVIMAVAAALLVRRLAGKRPPEQAAPPLAPP
jgi:hypothetical protein